MRFVNRSLKDAYLLNRGTVACGLTSDAIAAGVHFAYRTLDLIDAKLLESGLTRLAGLIELANLSTIIGNLIAVGIIKAAPKVFSKAGAHKYQDLRSAKCADENVEIKVALEKNQPKAHLAKEGYYLTFRYVLSDEKATPMEDRGDMPWIWEIRFGHLELRDFNVSNTDGDSGKTAVVNAAGMAKLTVIYQDPTFLPRRRVRAKTALLPLLK